MMYNRKGEEAEGRLWNKESRAPWPFCSDYRGIICGGDNG